ncbi:MAG: hypothetical protein AAGG51_13585 [Cyanobacteria bacterium P01_G01_bin.54]
MHPFQGHQDRVKSVIFSPDGNYIVSSSDDKTLRLWDLDGNPVGEPFLGHHDAVRSTVFSPDGESIASGSDDKTLRLWRSEDWRSWLRVCCDRLRNRPNPSEL